jgi:hypothetical protein
MAACVLRPNVARNLCSQKLSLSSLARATTAFRSSKKFSFGLQPAVGNARLSSLLGFALPYRRTLDQIRGNGNLAFSVSLRSPRAVRFVGDTHGRQKPRRSAGSLRFRCRAPARSEVGNHPDREVLWKDADPDIPILKQAKAQYAKAAVAQLLRTGDSAH